MGLYGDHGIRAELTDGLRAGRRPCFRDVDRVGTRGIIGVRHLLAVDNMRDLVDHPITPVHRCVEHAPSSIATDRERDG